MTPKKQDELYLVDLEHTERHGEARSFHVMAASFEDAERKAIKEMTMMLKSERGRPYVTVIRLLGDVIL